MFTGLVRENAKIISLEKSGTGLVIVVRSHLEESQKWAIGDSIAVNGVCLTIVTNTAHGNGADLKFELSPETLARTTFSEIQNESNVHLEPALRMGEPLGGHLVSGHVDGLGQIQKIEWTQAQDYLKLQFSVQGIAREKIAPFLVEKGSVAIDGVSLTVNEVMDWQDKTLFSVSLIPHTLNLTRFRQLEEGHHVNLEVDMVAKYVTRSLEFAKYIHSNHDSH